MSPASTKSKQTRGLLGLGPQAVPQTDGININWPLGLGPARLYHPFPGRGDSHAPRTTARGEPLLWSLNVTHSIPASAVRLHGNRTHYSLWQPLLDPVS